MSDFKKKKPPEQFGRFINEKPSVYKDAVVMTKELCEQWLNLNPPKSITNLVIEYTPPKAGNMMARINIAMLDHATIFVNPDIDPVVAPFMGIYGFRRADIENDENFICYQR